MTRNVAAEEEASRKDLYGRALRRPEDAVLLATRADGMR